MKTRPTEYSAEILHTAQQYLTDYEKLGDVVPTIEGLADELGRGTKTIYNWGDANPEFQAVLEAIMSKQGRLLQTKGLKKETDSGITKLLLSANHNKSEKSENKTDITTGGEKVTGFVIEFVNAQNGSVSTET